MPERPPLWYVRSFFREGDNLVFLDEGPWDHFLATCVLFEIGVQDATIPRGLGRVTVERAVLVAAE
jgi:hypothetical protein